MQSCKFTRWFTFDFQQSKPISRNRTVSKNAFPKKDKNGKNGKKNGNGTKVDNGYLLKKGPQGSLEELKRLSHKELHEIQSERENSSNQKNKEFFCNAPTSAYARVVIASNSPRKSLWSTEGIVAQCYVEEIFQSMPEYAQLCQLKSDRPDVESECCRAWSPATYAALLANRPTCLSVTERDLEQVEVTLRRCYYYYQLNQLLPNCDEEDLCRKKVPEECYRHNAAYHLIHYLLDVDFVSNVSLFSCFKSTR